MPVARQNTLFDAPPVEREPHVRTAIVYGKYVVVVVNEENRRVLRTVHNFLPLSPEPGEAAPVDPAAARRSGFAANPNPLGHCTVGHANTPGHSVHIQVKETILSI